MAHSEKYIKPIVNNVNHDSQDFKEESASKSL